MINSRKDLENYIRADRQCNIGSIGFLKYRLGLFMKSESCIAFRTAELLQHRMGAPSGSSTATSPV